MIALQSERIRSRSFDENRALLGARYHQVGYFQHHIKIDALQTELPIVTGDYTKGFDRLSTGIALQQFAGYLYAHPTYLINFYAGLTFTEGLTKSARGYNYDTLQKDEALRKDFSIGLKIG